MGESSSNQQQATSSSSSRLLGLKPTVGEIVEVQGGHIVRSIGRKDRHSKVCTAKGPRDRRVRLAAHTAIQFYDVQDRLGYDRPSKAVDWLIKKAKASIDELAHLPPWHPTAVSAPTCFEPGNNSRENDGDENQQQQFQGGLAGSASGKRAMTTMLGGEDEQQQGQISSFLPPSMDSDVIADTIKSFFPMEASSSAMQFQSFPGSDLLSRSSNHSQDLKLSLQSFQDPILLHHHSHHSQNLSHHHSEQQQQQQQPQHSQERGQAQVLLSGIPLGFDGTPIWPEQHHHQQQAAEISRFHRLSGWNSGGDASGGGAATSAGFLFNSPPAPQPLLQQLLGHNQFFSTTQRGPLQSSNTPSIRAWMDPSSVSTAADQNQQHHPGFVPIYPSVGFASGYGGFSGFHVPARIQGDEEEHDGYSDKPSSASSDSRH